MLTRIKQIMELENLSSSQFADEIGVQRSALSHVLSGRNNPSLDFVMKIKACFNEISLDWLLLGKGNMLISSNENTNSILRDNEIKDTLADDVDRLKTLFDSAGIDNANSDLQNDTIELPHASTPNSGGKAVKVILLYEDGSFKEYTR